MLYSDFSLEKNCTEFSGINIYNAVNDFGTPLILYSEKRIRENVKRIINAFMPYNISIHFAMKANYNPYILNLLKSLGCGIDAANQNEAMLALKLGFNNNDVVSTPNNLDREGLAFLINNGIKINYDHLGQYKLVQDLNPEFVSFRINPGIGMGEFKEITTAGENVKFGISYDEALKSYKYAREHGAKRFGIHMMTGSNVLSAKFFKESSRLFFNIAANISKKLDISFDYLDLGGGFGVPYRDNDPDFDIKAAAGYILENFENFNGIFNNSDLIIEPGRYIIADSAVLISRITSIKNYGHTIIGTDVSMNTLIRIPLYGAYHKIYIAGKCSDDKLISADIVGQACENTDYIARNIKIPSVNDGNIVIISNAGAYIMSMASNYNLLARPAEAIILDGNLRLIKKRESVDDMLKTFYP